MQHKLIESFFFCRDWRGDPESDWFAAGESEELQGNKPTTISAKLVAVSFIIFQFSLFPSCLQNGQKYHLPFRYFCTSHNLKNSNFFGRFCLNILMWVQQCKVKEQIIIKYFFLLNWNERKLFFKYRLYFLVYSIMWKYSW